MQQSQGTYFVKESPFAQAEFKEKNSKGSMLVPASPDKLCVGEEAQANRMTL
jgi:hypothetical protein